jgi:hypothetical protein
MLQAAMNASPDHRRFSQIQPNATGPSIPHEAQLRSLRRVIAPQNHPRVMSFHPTISLTPRSNASKRMATPQPFAHFIHFNPR